jgi:hypothetical protein
MATYQINANQGTVATTAKGTMALWSPSGALRRLKIYEFDIGATGAPNATDCNITIDLSRTINTSLVVGTAYVPNQTDPADGTADATSLVNITTELTGASISTGLPEYHNGMNQRNTIRWVAAQESQFLICQALLLYGHYMTVLSPNYAGSISTNVYYLE